MKVKGKLGFLIAVLFAFITVVIFTPLIWLIEIMDILDRIKEKKEELEDK